eukprot:Platyproteum_vivax@DN14356_c0_g1_i1.p1
MLRHSQYLRNGFLTWHHHDHIASSIQIVKTTHTPPPWATRLPAMARSTRLMEFLTTHHDTIPNQLQFVCDDILSHSHEYPPHVRRFHNLAVKVREQRRKFGLVKNNKIRVGVNCLSTVSKVIMCGFVPYPSTPQLLLTSSSQSGLDCMLEISMSGKKESVGSVEVQNFIRGNGTIFGYILETLEGSEWDDKVANQRVREWQRMLQSCSSSS